jgi:hypothetical protein
MWKDMEHDFTRINYQRKEMCSVMAYRSDADQLRKYKDIFLE